MNEQTKLFLEELKSRPDVLGVIMFGSWARGNNRPDSDVDLIVILSQGFKRAVEHRNGQDFEIIYTTQKSAVDFWKTHIDGCASLWEVAKIIYDKDGAIKKLEEDARNILQEGKKVVDKYQLGQFLFDAKDQLKVSRVLIEKDFTTANLILTNKIFFLTELFFDLRQLWTPAPKQRMAKIKEIKPKLYSELEKFYQDGILIQDRLKIAEKVVELVFDL